MQEDGAAAEGLDLLGLALGRVPGSSDLDEFVDFEIYFDGATKASQAGEAVPFLRARLCEVFEIIGKDLDRYFWHRDRFLLEAELNEDFDTYEPRLVGHVRTGDGAEDEWFVVYLLQRLTAARKDISCRVMDSDGELLLIETALAAPRWLDPSNAEYRCWLRGGLMHILPRPRPPEPEQISCRDALARLRDARGASAAKDKVQRALNARLEGFPRKAIDSSRHVARAVVPCTVARALLAYPQLVSVAVDHLPPASGQELTSLRRDLPAEEARVRMDCDGLSDDEVVCVGLRLTRCQYARLCGLHSQLPQRFSRKHWKEPRGTSPGEKAMRLGQLLCAGLETAYLHNSTGATAALRWPRPELRDALLPASAPWWLDSKFAQNARACEPALTPHSVAGRLAFLQQSELDESFQQTLRRVIENRALVKVVDFATYWRDRDDSEEWLQVSAEEIDREMQARQAEFDEYDRRRGASSTSQGPSAAAAAAASAMAAAADGGNAGTAGKASDPEPEQLQRDIAAMGQGLSALLRETSGAEGVDVRASQPPTGTVASFDGTTAVAGGPGREGRDDDSSASDEEDNDAENDDGDALDVLGMEDSASSGDEEDIKQGIGKQDGDPEGLHSYMAELDEQLEGALDTQDEGEASRPGSLPLSSHHVKVHGVEPVELNMHAMEHLLASFCSEHQLEPGPASLLLGELGMTSGVNGSGSGISSCSPLDAMD
eukprot:TRINITY_DN5045_c0_g3_i1.p1 TRINITY_DN5045_c0_g3~~TRINITY_DN5045_c0_g3_i1.p1  ORF type:complete len:736 (+),score=167.37 TRINITY_DN5045_c0_g3_i1:58-2208(+)